MVLAGIVVDVLFSVRGLVLQSPRPPSAVIEMALRWDYTTSLDIAAAIFDGRLLWLRAGRRA